MLLASEENKIQWNAILRRTSSSKYTHVDDDDDNEGKMYDTVTTDEIDVHLSRLILCEYQWYTQVCKFWMDWRACQIQEKRQMLIYGYEKYIKIYKT